MPESKIDHPPGEDLPDLTCGVGKAEFLLPLELGEHWAPLEEVSSPPSSGDPILLPCFKADLQTGAGMDWVNN